MNITLHRNVPPPTPLEHISFDSLVIGQAVIGDDDGARMKISGNYFLQRTVDGKMYHCARSAWPAYVYGEIVDVEMIWSF